MAELPVPQDVADALGDAILIDLVQQHQQCVDMSFADRIAEQLAEKGLGDLTVEITKMGYISFITINTPTGDHYKVSIAP